MHDLSSHACVQVEAKAKDLLAVIHAQSGHYRTLACLTLAARVVSQCEGQIARISSFAFPVAMVVVQVAASVPEVMELLLARLHKVSWHRLQFCSRLPHQVLHTR